MEHFYRHRRKQHDILMEGKDPAGGAWNFDKDNRWPFDREGPGLLPAAVGFTPDRITRAAVQDVETHLADNPGSCTDFAWPVNRPQALSALDDFVNHRLAAFRPFQDAMWIGEPYL